MAAAGFSSFGIFNSPQSSKLRLSDCTCSVCMYIIIEPVTMPCGHELCRPCFQQNVQEANLSCPMCRTRISTWTRKATRDNKLVNEKRWQQIKDAFPDKVQRRLEGKEELYSSDDEEPTLPQQYFQLAEDGDIRKEYEEQLKQLEEERLKAIQEEEMKSRQLIAQLEEEEKRALEEKQKRSNEDERLARELAEQLQQESAEKKAHQLRSTSGMDKFLKKTQRNADGTLPEDAYPFNSLTLGDKIPKYCASPGSLQDSSDMFMEDREDSFSHSEDYLYLQGNKDSALGLGIDIKLDGTPFSTRSSSSVIVLGSSPGSVMSTPVTSKKSAKKTKLDKWLARDNSTPPKSLISSFKSCSNIPKALEEESNSVSPATFFGGGAKCGPKKPPKTPERTPPPERTASSDSLGQEMVHFKPIQACPRTPPKKQPGGKSEHPPVIRSRPLNFDLSPGKEQGSEAGPSIPMTSPVMQRSLRFLQAQRQAHVSAFSKATLTDDKLPPKLSEQTYWSPKKNRIITVQHESSTSPDSPVSEKPVHRKKLLFPTLPDLPKEVVVVQDTPSLPDSSRSSRGHSDIHSDHDDMTGKSGQGDISRNPGHDDISRNPGHGDISRNPGQGDISRNPGQSDISRNIGQGDISRNLGQGDISRSSGQDDIPVEKPSTSTSETVTTGMKIVKITRKDAPPEDVKNGPEKGLISERRIRSVEEMNSAVLGIMFASSEKDVVPASQVVNVQELNTSSQSLQKGSQSIQGSQSQTVTSSQGKVYKMKRKTKRIKPTDISLPGSKYDVESWLRESESSMDMTSDPLDMDTCRMDDPEKVLVEKTGGKEPEDIVESEKVVEFTGVRRKRKKPCDTESVSSSKSTRSTRSTRSTTRAKNAKKSTAATLQKAKASVSEQEQVVSKTKRNEKEQVPSKSDVKAQLFGQILLSDGEKENSLDSFELNIASRPAKNSQESVNKTDDNEETKRSRLKLKRATADLDFSSGSPKKKKRMMGLAVDVEYSPTEHGGKKLMQRKGLQTKLAFLPHKSPCKNESHSKEEESAKNDSIPEEISNQLKELHDERLKLEDFATEKQYREYIEEQDRLMALKLQADFDFEARFHLNSVRRKGSDEEYQLRRGKRNTDYAQFFDSGLANRRPSRTKRK